MHKIKNQKHIYKASIDAKKIVGKTILNIIFLSISAFTLYPIIWMFYSSLKTEPEFMTNVISLPASPQFVNYLKAIVRGNLLIGFRNSLYVTAVTVVLILFLSYIVAYFVNRFQFRGKAFIYLLFTLGMLIPVHGFLVPMYIQFSKLDMNNKWYTLFFPDTAFSMPLAVILIENFLKGIPCEIEESAHMDGASISRRMFNIVFPCCMPIIVTLMILNILWIWNEFPFALTLINDTNLKTLPLGISNFKGERSTSFPEMLAALALVCTPIIVVYSFLSRKIMEGMTAGAVKE
jgi:raffinose/stachyose/melibiose transport system permease protein